MAFLPDTLREAAAKIQLLILDVDGVLTDGGLNYGAAGELFKTFNAKDGFGIKMLLSNGIEVAVITARQSEPLAKRMSDLGIEHVYSGSDDKVKAFENLLNKLSITPEQAAYVGDDVLDLPVMRLVGMPITPQDGHQFVKDIAVWVTSYPGGHGAVREVADGLLDSRGDLRQMCDDFLDKKVGKTKPNSVQ